jgi:hypothetical protein
VSGYVCGEGEEVKMQVVVGWSVRCIIVWSQQAARTENCGNGRRGRKLLRNVRQKATGEDAMFCVREIRSGVGGV